MKIGLFITLEGPEGSGKSTQTLLLSEYLKKRGFTVVTTREPGGTTISESLRKLLLDPHSRLAPVTELLLYEAGRAQHISEVVAPALEAGSVVICDRFTDATLAYQGYGRGIDLDIIRRLNLIATGGLMPDLTIFLDTPVEQGLQKARQLNRESFLSGDRMEREDIEFHTKVCNGYYTLAEQNPDRIKVIKARPQIEETHKVVTTVVEEFLATCKGPENL